MSNNLLSGGEMETQPYKAGRSCAADSETKKATAQRDSCQRIRGRDQLQVRVLPAQPLPPGWPTLQEQREYWLKKEQEWVGCNGGENDHMQDEQQYSNYTEEQL